MKNQNRVFILICTLVMVLIAGIISENILSVLKAKNAAISGVDINILIANDKKASEQLESELQKSGLKPYPAGYWKKLY